MTDHAVFELRRYRLKPGARETLIALFDAEFIAPQRAAGMSIPGEYRDRDDPNAFVWFRSFPDMARRAEALDSFYSGRVWATHGPAANATMVNSDNVLLLRSSGHATPFCDRGADNGAASGDEATRGVITVAVCSLAPRREREFADFFAKDVRPALARAGARIDAMLISEPSPNTFPRLPVREGETVFVWVAGFANDDAYDAYRRALAADEEWRGSLAAQFDAWLWRPVETARLAPTAQSRHHW